VADRLAWRAAGSEVRDGFNPREGFNRAAQELIDSAEKHDGVRLDSIFGPQGNAILTSGNVAQDRAEQDEFSKLAGTKHRLIADPTNSSRVILSIGDEDWPFPVPIARSNEKWSFDVSAVRMEMEARRIGAHELDANRAAIALPATSESRYCAQVLK